MAGRLDGKVAVITGGCSGIGLATVRRFAEEGAKVVIGDLDDVNGPRIADEVGGTFVRVDVVSKEDVDALFRTAKETYGSVDIAFNNAGISPPEDDSILDTDLDAWRKVQEVNLTSVYLCCKAALPYMLEQGKGSIINTASFVAVMGAATSQISYSASKGGVLSMSRELGVQFARQGVRVNALCPGPVNTPLLQELFAKDEERAARRLVHVPMGRFGEPEEMANAVLFLASDESSFITASTFLVDGGISGAYVTPLWRRVRDVGDRPVIGITAYVERASWGRWVDVPGALVPHRYVGQRRGRRWDRSRHPASRPTRTTASRRSCSPGSTGSSSPEASTWHPSSTPTSDTRPCRPPAPTATRPSSPSPARPPRSTCPCSASAAACR